MKAIGDYEALIYNYKRLVDRSVAIIHKASFSAFINDKSIPFASLDIDGDEATLSWPESAYDSSFVVSTTTRFPSRLLFLTDDELAAWQASEVKRIEEERKKQQEMYAAARAIEQEMEERRLLAKLSVKYAGRR